LNLPRLELSWKPATAAALMMRTASSLKESILPQCACGLTLLDDSILIYMCVGE
jgi:hypothetical protein